MPLNAKKRTDLSNHILIWKHNESEAQKSEEENPQETEKQVKGILFKQFVC